MQEVPGSRMKRGMTISHSCKGAVEVQDCLPVVDHVVSTKSLSSWLVPVLFGKIPWRFCFVFAIDYNHTHPDHQGMRD
jgi:hypothetical protein